MHESSTNARIYATLVSILICMAAIYISPKSHAQNGGSYPEQVVSTYVSTCAQKCVTDSKGKNSASCQASCQCTIQGFEKNIPYNQFMVLNIALMNHQPLDPFVAQQFYQVIQECASKNAAQ